MGNPLLRRSQLAPEAVVGTALTATKQLSGAFSIHNAPERVRREEYRASFVGSNTYDDLAYRSEGTYRGRCTTAELPFFLASSIDGSVAPSGGVWTYNQPLSSIPALKSLCIYPGDNTQALRSAGTFTRRFTIEGRDTAAWTFDADMLGREQVISGASFAALTTIANSSIKNLLSRLYIDDTGAGIGGTQKTVTFYGFRFQYESGIEPDYTMDGALDMTDILRGEPSATLELTAKWNAAAVTEFTNWRNITTRFVRISNTGITIDGAYKITGFDPIAEERNGASIARMTLAMVEDTTWNKALSIAVTSSLTGSDLPVA